jgi:circadian clock protein KaiB
MGSHSTVSIREDFEESVVGHCTERVILQLYINGMSPCSTEAIAHVQGFCETHLTADRYELEIIDLNQNPELAAEEEILVVPTLIKKLPLPLRRLVGGLANNNHVLARLDLT